MAQVATNNQRFEVERNLQLALERQGRDIVEIRKQGRPLFHGFLKSDYGASSSSQVDPEEPVPLWTAPPSPYFRPPYPPSN
ncbi:hypothetical protein PIB30_095462 [Stylosanthes scabra]|uniref:Uncharacterized protein n=1 Tax=Stylosanthes scabra TaxID=79078 RepID=A0ABU6VVL7_9FABA|nr:hypothetical protein [Stylosanthes scabra]